jgi:GH25 family lysozyme M1 (1,4-beta-N-acetylmuramidase)
VPPYHRLPRLTRSGKGQSGQRSTDSTSRSADRPTSLGRRTIAIRAALAVALVGGAVVATSAVAGASPAPTASTAQTAREAAERGLLTHPDRDFMGWSGRQATVDAGKLPKSATLPGTRITATTVIPAATAAVAGVDVSHWQGNTNWAYWWSQNRRFAWVKATEGTTYRDPSFNYQYTGSFNVGMIRGSYHFATPNTSTGAAQANFFVAHGGGWSRDGRTLPGVLDIEYNPYGATCYGLSQAAMVSWVRSFTTTYKALTGRDAVIYTSLSWWTTCTGNSAAFSGTNPLWVPRYASNAGTLPGGWGFYTVWQHTDTPLDEDLFNGSLTRLKALANG